MNTSRTQRSEKSVSYGERGVGYHLASAGVVIDMVALIGGLIVVYAICKQRAPQGH